VAGGRARPLLGHWTLPSVRSSGGAGVCSGQTVPLALESGQAVAPDGTVRTTTCCWSRWAIVMWRFVIGPFELKFDRLNTNSTV
jgi:hypothetical protein